MRIASSSNRLKLVVPGGALDVEKSSEGRFSADPQRIYDVWDAFASWARSAPAEADLESFDPQSADLDAPAPRPRQVFAIGLNYRQHAAESQVDYPDEPPTFTKFPSSLAGPNAALRLPPGTVDWEAELVAVIGRRAEGVRAADGWDHIAGLTVGQDFSERRRQTAGPLPQFSLGKSHRGFGPMGPCLVTPEHLDDRDDLAISCEINGETVQKDRTSSMIFSVPELVARLSAVCVLYPGDVLFTGTPAGVGHARKPPRYLSPGDVVTTRIEGLGEMQQRCL